MKMSIVYNIETILNGLTEFLKTQQIKPSILTKDGRVNSTIDEISVIKATQKYFKDSYYNVVEPNIREWYDFSIESKDGELFIPVNIKSSVLATDNLNCKLGIIYAVTGIRPEELGVKNNAGWEKCFDVINKNYNINTDKDYYFLIMNKNDETDFFWNSLKQIPKLIPNGNNLPFQANWAKCKERIKRTNKEANKFILTALRESIYRRVKICQIFNEKVNCFINNE